MSGPERMRGIPTDGQLAERVLKDAADRRAADGQLAERVLKDAADRRAADRHGAEGLLGIGAEVNQRDADRLANGSILQESADRLAARRKQEDEAKIDQLTDRIRGIPVDQKPERLTIAEMNKLLHNGSKASKDGESPSESHRHGRPKDSFSERIKRGVKELFSR